MSNTFVEVVRLTAVEPHPDADRLHVATVYGTTVVVPRGQYVTGQKVVYFPPNMLIPERVAEEFGVAKYLKMETYPGDTGKSHCRVAACRLRGVPSFGFIVSLEDAFGTDVSSLVQPGDDVSHHFQAVKYEPPVNSADAAPEHPQFHRYTDIQNYSRHPDLIEEGTEVRITEKIHGSNCRVGLVAMGDGEFRFMAGSNKVNRAKPEGRKCKYWEPLENENMLNLLTDLCNEKHTVIVFGELFGPGIQDLDYGVEAGERGFRVFDITIDGQYQDFDTLLDVCGKYSIPMVPVLYVGPFYKPLVEKYTYGETLVGTPRCKFKGREGIVITAIDDPIMPNGRRRIVKSISADYLDRKGAQDNE